MGIENGKKMGSWAGGDEHQRGQCVARLPRSKRLAVLLLRTEDVINGQQETSHTLEAIRKLVLGNLRVFSDSENNLEK